MLRLRGGKPTLVRMMTNHLPCGPEVTIDVEEDEPISVIKKKLAAVTGVPPEHQRVLLGGISQMIMGDKRTSLRFGTCGVSYPTEEDGEKL